VTVRSAIRNSLLICWVAFGPACHALPSSESTPAAVKACKRFSLVADGPSDVVEVSVISAVVHGVVEIPGITSEGNGYPLRVLSVVIETAPFRVLSVGEPKGVWLVATGREVVRGDGDQQCTDDDPEIPPNSVACAARIHGRVGMVVVFAKEQMNKGQGEWLTHFEEARSIADTKVLCDGG